MNGARVVAWAPATHTHAHTPSRSVGDLATYPRCPKHCDVATPPEHGGGDQWVCSGCGTQFTWKGKPS